MTRLSRTSLIAVVLLFFVAATTVVSLSVQRVGSPQRSGSPSPPAMPDITGSWERFEAGTIGRGQGTDPRTPPPVPQPPLKAKDLADRLSEVFGGSRGRQQGRHAHGSGEGDDERAADHALSLSVLRSY